MQDSNFDKLLLLLKHDDNAEVYINGIPAYNCNCWTDEYLPHELSPEVKASLKKGKLTVFASLALQISTIS